MAYEIYHASKSKKVLWFVPGAGHTKAYAVAEEEYQKPLKVFLEDAINSNSRKRNLIRVKFLFLVPKYLIAEFLRVLDDF
ncbi:MULTISPECIES: hypothetical protein [unclassified Bacillus (in: firmicutes)]|uniref:hypothetical protein n=1 Tax=unclassified Bacillus (in: firmicutes) TaxID=185979 RepID=UPI0011457249|nr:MULTISPECIES: hypothetical protein [unclassified Bacillus (in: firmicutes)]